MDPARRQKLENLLGIHQARLDVLEQQAARYGYSAPPHVVTEIAELRQTIESIKGELEADGPPSEPASSAITILFLAAEPSELARLRLGEEFRIIQEKLQRSRYRERFKLEPRMAVRPEDFTQALLDVRPQVVHFCGHGTTTGALCFENDRGEAHPVSPEALGTVFRKFSGEVECVVLNACFAAQQGQAIAEHIDYVIGMSAAISDPAAIAFATGFYQALGGGEGYVDAYDLGCAQISLMGIPEALKPVLVPRRGSATGSQS